MAFIPSTCCPKPAPSPFSMPSRPAVEWALANPVLGQGACAYESDTGKWKLGNGTDKYMDLQYESETGATGPSGPTGPSGFDGAVGPPCTLKIGSVTTGATASASISGKAPTYTLNLVLPTASTVTPVDPTVPTPDKPGKITFSVNPTNAQAQEGFAVVYAAEATCTPADTITYRWQRQEGYGGSWVDVGAGSGPRLIFNAKTSDNGDNFRCVASAPSAPDSYSNGASCTVFPMAPAGGNAAIILHPLPVWCRFGDRVTFACSLNAGGAGGPTQVANYKWFIKRNGASEVFTNATSPVFSLNVTGADAGAQVRCQAWYSLPGSILYPGFLYSETATVNIL